MPHPDPSAASKNIWTGFEEDGLACAKLKEHSRGKLQLLAYYLQVFAGSMARKFENRYYIDLYAGPGRGRMKKTGEIIEGSPLIACRTVPHFSKLIFCEEDPERAAALAARINRDFHFLSTRVIPKNCNDGIEEILAELPASVLGFLGVCFVDPYNLAIRLKTIRRLAHLKIDFVMLVADRMAGSRAEPQLTAPGSMTIEDLLDDSRWRERWDAAKKDGEPFNRFISREFTAAMAGMGFLAGRVDRVNVANMKVGLYQLVLFSKDQLALDFWASASKRARDQLELL